MIRRTGLLSILLSIVLLCSCVFDIFPTSLRRTTAPTLTSGEMQAIFLDVGQADCILLKTADHALLIDAGNTGQDNLILGYLATYGIKRLDYIVATHPHADHIGAMASVIRAMDSVGAIVMPDAINTTRSFENMLDAIEEKGVPITIASSGKVITMGDMYIQILAPNSDGYADLNDFSIVLRIEFGRSVFLFTGDADTKSENEQLASGLSLRADVLKVGHHGSRTSSTQRYLNAVAPQYAVISCGHGNTYGHPHSEAMARLTGTGAAVYRTDINGTIVFTTNGVDITVNSTRAGAQNTLQASATTQPTSLVPTTYIGNINSKVFHLPTCPSLPQEQNRIYFTTRDGALNAGFTPCSVCKP